MDKNIKEMKKDSKNLAASIIIGKNGLTEQVIKNIALELRKNDLVKIKILPSLVESEGKEALFEEIAEKTGAKIVQKIGFTITLTKR
ncbi:MAG TPA: YhbY family RNA-binding protein [Alphaproteobacteria bacterium]|nr:YhbY family RNA-binding protein [Alphaproteobacteria bacterium]